MSFGRFIKQNFALSVGIALPVVLVFVFLAVTIIPKRLAAPPHYKVAYTTVDYSGNAPLSKKIKADITAKDGKIILSLEKTKGDYAPPRTRLMVYDPAAGTTDEVNYKLPDGLRGETEEEVLSETKQITLSTSRQAPDGYVYEEANWSSGGLATELFAGGYRNGSRLVKGAVAYPLPDDTRYQGIRFLGWIIEDKAE